MGTTLPEADQSQKLQAELCTVAWLITTWLLAILLSHPERLRFLL